MTDRLALLARSAVRSAVAREFGLALEYHPSLGSTQDRARELAPGPALVVADLQTAGRGTRDRRWMAPAGAGLLVSFVLPGPPAAAPQASLVAGVAVARALDRLGAPGATLKWPNDVLLAGRKVAGILTQVSTGPAGSLVVGVGLNVHQSAEDLAALPGGSPAATSLRLEGCPADRLAVLALLADELARLFDAPPGPALDQWRARSSVLGRAVTVHQAGEPEVSGVATALEPDGALRVQTAYGPLRILVGEVSTDHE